MFHSSVMSYLVTATVILLGLQSSESYSHHQEALGTLLTDFALHFFSGCIYILHNLDNKGTCMTLLDVVFLQKKLSELQVQTAVLDIHEFISSFTRLRCNNNVPVYVCLCSDSSTVNVLSKLNRRIAGPIWLMVLPPGETFRQELLTGVNIPLDSEFLVIWQPSTDMFRITEVYRISENSPLESYYYGDWTHATGPQGWPDLEVWKRRNDLKGYVLNATSLSKYSAARGLEIEDYSWKVWKTLEQQMNFRTAVSFPPDMAWGSVDEQGNWNGMVAMLQSRQVDVAVKGFMMTSQRASVMDFTTPLMLSRFFLLVKEPNTVQSDWYSYIRPFTWHLWAAILVMLILATICLTFAGLVERDDYTFSNSLFTVFVSLIQQSHDFLPVTSSGRLPIVMSCLISVVLVSAYSGILISFLTVQRLYLPFSDFRGVLKSGYKLEVLQKSAEYNLFSMSHSSLFLEMYRKMLHPNDLNLPLNNIEAFQRVCEAEKKVFLSTASALMDVNAEANCTLMAIKADMFKATLGLGFIKNSPYRGITNYNINLLRSTGILRRLVTGTMRPTKTVEKKLPDVVLEDVLPLLMELMAGMLISILLLLMECIYAKLKYRSQAKKTKWRS